MVFEKEYIMRCSSAEWIARNGCALRWWHRGVGRQTEETVGFPEWTAQFSVWKTTGEDGSEAWAIACQNCAVYSVFQSGMMSHSKILQFNWEGVGRLILTSEWWSFIQLRVLFSAVGYLHFVQLVVAKQLRDKITCQFRRHVTVFILDMIIDSKYLRQSDVTSKKNYLIRTKHVYLRPPQHTTSLHPSYFQNKRWT